MSDPRPAPTPAPPGPFLRALEGARRFLLVGHERPDGDCLGAQSALARLLRARGREVRLLNPDPPDRHLEFLVADLDAAVFDGGPLPAHDAFVLLDGAELGRCGALGEALERDGGRRLVIDHHLHEGQPWWDAAYLDPTAAATGLLVWRLAHALGLALDRAAADAVFTALVTDTGWFRHPNADAETFRAAAELVAAGVEPARLARAIRGGRPREHPLELGRLLGSVEFLADGRLALLIAQEADGARSAAVGEEALDVVRRVEGVEVALHLRRVGPGEVKLSARSEGELDVCALARRFGGGGHRRAAGARIRGALEAAREQVVEAALDALGPAVQQAARRRERA